MTRCVVIVAVWRRPLDLSLLQKPFDQRLIVVGPKSMIHGENNIDTFHYVDGPVSRKDKNYASIIQKVLELCAGLGTTRCRLLTFERALQQEMAQIRTELNLEGLRFKQYYELFNRKEMKSICKKGSVPSARSCSLSSITAHLDQWVDHATNNVGRYPIVVRPQQNVQYGYCGMRIIHNPDEFSDYLKEMLARQHGETNKPIEIIAEECVADGQEVVVMFSSKTGLFAAMAAVEPSSTFLSASRHHEPYAIEYLNADQTRDNFPGLETFVTQTMKSIFPFEHSEVLFLKAFYKTHSNIKFMNVSLEIHNDTLASLFAEANKGKSWEAAIIESIFDTVLTPIDEPTSPNGFSTATTDVVPQDHMHYAVLNYPTTEGIILHQVTIPKRKSTKRVAWRVYENEEMIEAEYIDDNIVQVYLYNSDRQQLLGDIRETIRRTHLPIDKFTPIDKNAVRWRKGRKEDRFFSVAGNTLIRSCTTAD
ncbi:unnamed protein product [Bursaphelenchus xylophilus]|uniref:(pine wood nematode) hypothetical protein n=1 Tax=Bursaphelenchus xylophilus TaxID=6326 RepID=A0A1I7RMJ9_BURXY|nr:unnamed protein product [Bursaphelenchus xylophilus]CAG9125749.1 unnamed protein product [Bursaphelenchus xylophilus]